MLDFLKNNKSPLASFLLNVANFVSVLVCICILMKSGTEAFRYFTIDSNIFAALACLPIGFKSLLVLMGKRIFVPRWITVLKGTGTIAVSVTFMTVMVFLGPTISYREMLSGINLWLHLICPLLCFVSFLFFDVFSNGSERSFLFGLLPVILYGILYFIQVIPLGNWPDFYGFNRGGAWVLSAVLMAIGTLGLSFAFFYLAKRFSSKK